MDEAAGKHLLGVRARGIETGEIFVQVVGKLLHDERLGNVDKVGQFDGINDLRTESGKIGECLVHHGVDVGVVTKCIGAPIAAQHTNAPARQPLGIQRIDITRRLIAIGHLGARIGRVCPGHRIEHQGSVAHAACNRAAHIHGVRQRDQTILRHQPYGGPYADQAVVGRWQADRRAGI